MLIGMALGQCPEILDNFKIRIVRWPLKHLNLELREKTLRVLGTVAGCILLLEEHLIDVEVIKKSLCEDFTVFFVMPVTAHPNKYSEAVCNDSTPNQDRKASVELYMDNFFPLKFCS
jgi:hypothetical protein